MTTDHDRMQQHWLVFDDPQQTLSAVRTLRGEGFEIADVHSPFPIHGIEEALGWRETRLPYATFVGGAIGLAIAGLIQLWTHAVDWPLNIGGKSNLAIPALVPVAFELIVLLAAFATVGGLLYKGRLFPTTDARRPKRQPISGVSDDRFVVRVVERDGSFSARAFAQTCKRLGPKKVLWNRRPA
jgi:hypothetical protein